MVPNPAAAPPSICATDQTVAPIAAMRWGPRLSTSRPLGSIITT